MPLSLFCYKKTIYNKETKREAKNERRKNERSQSRDKKAITADSVPDPIFRRCQPRSSWGFPKI